MKKILVSLIAILLAVGLVGGGAFAYFSDVETSSGNTFTAGTIDIEVNGDNPWTEPFVFTHHQPCEFEWVTYKVKNVGNNPLNLWKHIGNITDVGGDTSEPECVAEGGVWTNPNGPCVGGTPCDDISTQIIYSLYIDVGKDGINYPNDIIIVFHCADGGVGCARLSDRQCEWVVICHEDQSPRTDISGETYTPLPPLQPGEEVWIWQDYHLHSDCGNEYQGDSTSFEVTFYAEQLGGPGK